MKSKQQQIFNTFDYEYTNGFTEGCNNKIKVLKRNVYVYRNFKRFRNRIFFIFNSKISKEMPSLSPFWDKRKIPWDPPAHR